jgi:hypothetical protein
VPDSACGDNNHNQYSGLRILLAVFVGCTEKLQFLVQGNCTKNTRFWYTRISGTGLRYFALLCAIAASFWYTPKGAQSGTEQRAIRNLVFGRVKLPHHADTEALT